MVLYRKEWDEEGGGGVDRANIQCLRLSYRREKKKKKLGLESL